MSDIPEETINLESGTAPRVRLTEIGSVGLKVSNGQILEESKRELRWPQSINTFKRMGQDPTIFAALQLFQLLISRVEWDVEAPDGASDEVKKKAEWLETIMDDMEGSWLSFIKEASSSYQYGFSVHEKVFRRRYRANGSKYNDGYIGVAKLPIRSQDTITKWGFSDDGRKLEYVEQSLQNISDFYRFQPNAASKVSIPRNKFLLFRTDAARDNPEGNSPLKACFYPWKYRTAIEESEAIGITRGLRGGIPYIGLPPKYMSPDASPEEKAVYEYYKNIIRNIHNNEQSGIVMPLLYDPESKQKLFEFNLLATKGDTNYDPHQAIQRYDNKILMALFADLLKMGQDKVGSYSLADSKTNVMAMAIDARLREIADVLNTDLVPQLFNLNGWYMNEYPKFVYGDLDEKDIAEFAKAIQQLAAVGMVAKTAKNINYVAEIMELPEELDETMSPEEVQRVTGQATTGAGQGYSSSTGGLNGTGNSASGKDNSANNLGNK